MHSESKVNLSNIYVVDDDPSVRKGVCRLLEYAGYDVKAFASAEAFLDYDLELRTPSCLVLDVKMPGIDGLELQDKLFRKSYILPIVFISGHGNVPMSVKAMKRGAVDFLSKPFDEKDLIDAIEEALAKADRALADVEEIRLIEERLRLLTNREHEVMTYVITGMLNKQIAFDLDISEKTVKVHRGRVMEKLGVDSVAELVRLAEKARIGPADVKH
jgi:FixJ family two-component response regulator